MVLKSLLVQPVWYFICLSVETSGLDVTFGTACVVIYLSVCLSVGTSSPDEQCPLSTDVVCSGCCGSHYFDHASGGLLKVNQYLAKTLRVNQY